MPKRAIRIPALRAGRRLRWTIEMSADVDGENGKGARKGAKKRHRATTVHRATPVVTATAHTDPIVEPPPALPVAHPTAPVVHPTAPVVHPTAPARRGTHLQMIAAAMITICVVTLSLSRRPAPLAAATAEDAQPEKVQQSSDIEPGAQPVATALAPTVAAVAVAPIVAPPAVRESTAKAVAAKTEKNRIAEAASPAAAVNAIDEALSRTDSPTELAAPAPISADPAPVSPDAVGPGAVTVTGCLETSGADNRFRLTDTDGVDAPKSRSWRTGFLRKRSTSVDLVEPSDPHALEAQVGQRVTATGLLTNRELRVTSLHALGTRCN